MPEKGVGRIGLELRLRWMPHHDHEIDRCTFRGNRCLGRAFLSNEVSDEMREKVLNDRDEHSEVLRQALKRSAERKRTPSALRPARTPRPRHPHDGTGGTRRTPGNRPAHPTPPRRRAEPYQPLTPIPAGWIRPGQATALPDPSSEDI
ncbi:hypothetical protein [Streptomyces sp. NBC_01716]|uniref:hypothetical protein n=1 Tax=Streptomyces sp. NBC_01716 TaxID=2975917 RepID=UPI002E350806|nr:hypothetical protein [Streptomyces sp. NBC_01716]